MASTRTDYQKTLRPIDYPDTLPAGVATVIAPFNADSPTDTDELVRFAYQDASRTLQTFMSFYGGGKIGYSSSPIFSSAGNISMQATNQFDVTSGDVDFNITNGIDINCGDVFSVQMNANVAASRTMVFEANNADGDGTANIYLNADDQVQIDGSNLDVNIGGQATIDTSDATTFQMAVDFAGNRDLSFLASNAGSGVGNIVFTADGALDVNASGAAAIDAALSSNFTVTADDASDKTLTLQSTNVGAGDGLINIKADQINFQDGKAYIDENGNLTTCVDVYGGFFKLYTTVEEVTIAAAASTTSTFQFPAGSYGTVSALVTTSIPDTTSMDIGITGFLDAWGNDIATTATTNNDGYSTSFINTGTSDISVTFTPNATPSAATGKVRIKAVYMKLGVPTS